MTPHNTPLSVSRTGPTLHPDQTRVLLRPFLPGGAERVASIVERTLAVDEEQVGPLLEEISAEFAPRHRDLRQRFLDRYEQVRGTTSGNISEGRRLLIGAYFLAEYSLESAALFNPSIVAHPDQSGLPPGAVRIVLSLRATGEGHISSITFRTGVIHADHRIEILPPAPLLTEPRRTPNPCFEKALFARKLAELGCHDEFTQAVLGHLAESFALHDLRAGLDARLVEWPQADAQAIWALALSNYEVQFDPSEELSSRILFPTTASQRNGIEDARFVRFTEADGSVLYYATFTAYDGRLVMPELVETSDFRRFRFTTLNGPAARNKGLALFPRRIDGRYAMISRQDNESIYLMYSENVHFWNEYQLLLKPAFPWELVQLGNCGSPIETEAGWLVLSHGVGPMRKYCIGAFLLDRDNPGKVLGRLREPLLMPNVNEREGYVPNVVYTCGSLVHGDTLIMPYGFADHATSFATLPLRDLLNALQPDV